MKRKNRAYRVLAVLHVCLLWGNIRDYIEFLDGRKGNLFEFLLSSLNYQTFVILFGTVSMWMLMTEYDRMTSFEIYRMVRVGDRRKYDRQRLKSQSVTAALFTLLLFGMYLAGGFLAGFRPGNQGYTMEWGPFDSSVLCGMVVVFYVLLSSYLIYTAWLLDFLRMWVKNGKICFLIQGILAVAELAISKSMFWNIIAWLPSGNAMVYTVEIEKSFLAKAAYWLLLLLLLYDVRMEVGKRQDVV